MFGVYQTSINVDISAATVKSRVQKQVITSANIANVDSENMLKRKMYVNLFWCIRGSLIQQLLDVLLFEDKANMSLKNLTFICPHSGKEALQCPQRHLFILPVSGTLCLFLILTIFTDKLQKGVMNQPIFLC